MSRKYLLVAGLAAGVILLPTAALAQAVGSVTLTGTALYGAIAVTLWFAVDKIIDLLPIRENTIVQLIRNAINGALGKQRP